MRPEEMAVVTLQIEHRITDYPTWKSAFDRFAEARARAGVLEHRIRRPVDDGKYLVIELDFDSEEKAGAFSEFLTAVVWANPDASPALDGAPTSRLLAPVDH